tara:strand:- start:312 stop:980 length:669 start_codon:yes stop_codon:yes gene_type:complete
MTNKKEILEHGLDEILKWIARCNFKRRSVKQGQFIVTANSKVDEIYWSEEARFSIIHMAENGKTLSLGDYHSKNNFFGEIEFFSERSGSFSAIASENLELTCIPKDTLTQFFLHNGHAAFWMNHRISSIYLSTMDIAIERSLYPLKYNILKDILRRESTSAQDTSHHYIYQEAQRFGCSDRAYARVIKELISDGLIKKGTIPTQLKVIDLTQIENYLKRYHT